MEFVPVLVMAALVKKAVDFVKYLMNGDMNAVITQLVTWVIGVGLAFLFAHSDFGSSIELAGTNMAALNPWALVLVGLQLASTASLGWDALKSFDNTDSASTPPMLPAKKAATTPVVKSNAAEAAAN